MKIEIGKQTIELYDPEVKTAKQIVSKFLSNVQKTSQDNHRPTFYFTVLAVAHSLSSELLKMITPETIELVIQNDQRKQRQLDTKIRQAEREMKNE